MTNTCSCLFRVFLKKAAFAACALVLFLLGGRPAYAASVTFNFNYATSGPSLSAGAGAATIAAYMDSVLGCVNCVTVVGAAADHTYNGEGHVTGPGTGATSLTLGTSDGAMSSTTASVLESGTALANDNFLATTTDASANVGSQITLRFSAGYALTGNISFDYEIFPDGTCTALNNTNCGGAGNPNRPDMTFTAGTNTNGVDPVVAAFGTAGTQWGVTPGTTNGNSISSPCTATNTGSSCTGSPEVAPQYIGLFAGTVANGTTELNFLDWPATIGIDNLKFDYCTNCPPSNQGPVPEPTSMLLLGTGVVGGYLRRKKLQKVQRS